MKRRAILVLFGLLAALVVVGSLPAAAAYQVYLNLGFGMADQGVRGGEFRVQAIPGDGSWYQKPSDQGAMMAAYRKPTGQGGRYGDLAMDFATFCAQRTVYWADGAGPYDVTLDTQTDQGVALTPGAEYLYDLWYNGTLAQYGYNTADRDADARELQRLIWWYMGEMPIYAPADPNHAHWQQWKNLGDNPQPVFGVKIMKCKYLGAESQDLMVLGKTNGGYLVPEPGSLALLAIGALGMLPLLRRRTTT